MRSIPTVTFLFAIDALAVALLVVLLGGCAATPVRYSQWREQCVDRTFVIREDQSYAEQICQRPTLGPV
jgi:hypothetical protein